MGAWARGRVGALAKELADDGPRGSRSGAADRPGASVQGDAGDGAEETERSSADRIAQGVEEERFAHLRGEEIGVGQPAAHGQRRQQEAAARRDAHGHAGDAGPALEPVVHLEEHLVDRAERVVVPRPVRRLDQLGVEDGALRAQRAAATAAGGAPVLSSLATTCRSTPNTCETDQSRCALAPMQAATISRAATSSADIKRLASCEARFAEGDRGEAQDLWS